MQVATGKAVDAYFGKKYMKKTFTKKVKKALRNGDLDEGARLGMILIRNRL